MRSVAVVAGMATGLALFAAPAATAAVTPSVRIAAVRYDPPGSDDRSAVSLNAEWVQLTNTTRAAVDLSRWTLTDASGHRYTFGTWPLGRGQSVYVRTGTGRDGSPYIYQRSGNYIWNNTGDTATLRNARGLVIDARSYRPRTGDQGVVRW